MKDSKKNEPTASYSSFESKSDDSQEDNPINTDISKFLPPSNPLMPK
jgi:hypothetical protein